MRKFVWALDAFGFIFNAFPALAGSPPSDSRISGPQFDVLLRLLAGECQSARRLASRKPHHVGRAIVRANVCEQHALGNGSCSRTWLSLNTDSTIRARDWMSARPEVGVLTRSHSRAVGSLQAASASSSMSLPAATAPMAINFALAAV